MVRRRGGCWWIRSPLFVSWRRGEELRGCLGTFDPQPLGRGLREYAIASASRDRRFDPIAKRELPRLAVAVSLLEDFRQIEHHLDWRVGEDGLIARFNAHSQSFSATFLPEVALEQGWSQHETLLALISKSGYRGAVSSMALEDLSITTYRSRKAALTYREYVAAETKIV